MMETFNCILAREGHDGVALDGESAQGLGRFHNDGRSITTGDDSVATHVSWRAGFVV